MGGSKAMEYVGAAIMGAGIYGSTQTEHWWIPLLLGSPGLLMIARSVLHRRRIRKDIMKLLEKDVADISYEELEKRVKESDYEPLGRDEEKVKRAEMDEYYHTLVHDVMKREHLLVNRVPSLAGYGVVIAGLYVVTKGKGFENLGTTLLGLTITSVGAVIAFLSEYRAFKKMRKLKKDVKRVMYGKGYEFFKLHANKQRTYDFYKQHILPEITGKPAASE
jgi:hypothetical protein